MSVVELDKLRVQITALDSELLSLLANRQKYTNQVAETKIRHHIPVRDHKREAQALLRAWRIQKNR